MRKPQFTKVLRLVGAICLSLAGSWLTAQTTTLEVSQPAATRKCYQNEEPGRAVNLPSGINDSFLDPEMKVEDFIKRFETESREVFSCRKQILAAVQLEPGMAVADVAQGLACIWRHLLMLLATTVRSTRSISPPNFVKHLRRAGQAREARKCGSGTLLRSRRNLKPNSVDRVFICDVYHHFEYPDSSLASIYAALRAGGQLILVDFNNDGAGEPRRVA
ncbi:MAG: methyltransferase domain-containing protein [Pirellulaceae bacterium]